MGPGRSAMTSPNSLTCERATQEEMVSIREAIDRISPRTPPSLWKIRPVLALRNAVATDDAGATVEMA